MYTPAISRPAEASVRLNPHLLDLQLHHGHRQYGEDQAKRRGTPGGVLDPADHPPRITSSAAIRGRR
jgi:hypothetical protein